MLCTGLRYVAGAATFRWHDVDSECACAQLDLHQRGAPVLGEEQLVDVELDRGTMFADERLNEIPTTNWDGASAQATANGKRERRNASRKLAEEVPGRLTPCVMCAATLSVWAQRMLSDYVVWSLKFLSQ